LSYLIWESQIKKIQKVKSSRDQQKLNKALNDLTECAKTGKGNLLKLSIEAARVRATVGEISFSLEKIFGRYQASNTLVSGAYSSEYNSNDNLEKIKKKVINFEKEFGRRPRILVAKVGQDGHDRGAKVIGTGFSDLGFDVDIGPLFATSKEVVRQAIDNDVHIIGISTLAGGHRTLVPEIIEELKKFDLHKILVIVGGIIPQQDYDSLKKVGVSLIFGPGTKIPEAVNNLLDTLIPFLKK